MSLGAVQFLDVVAYLIHLYAWSFDVFHVWCNVVLCHVMLCYIKFCQIILCYVMYYMVLCCG